MMDSDRPGPPPSIDKETLIRLRTLVKSMQANQQAGIPHREITELAAFDEEAAITIDFAAQQDLGQPVIVMQVPRREQSTALCELTDRETEVAGLVGRGLTNKEIAAKLFITVGTVKDHVHNILEKTGLPNRAAIAAAVRS
jgi:DNA-binding NarL/FixJ family response regulator